MDTTWLDEFRRAYGWRPSGEKRKYISDKKRIPSGPDDIARLNEMVDLRKSGYTLQKIGDKFGISRERVRQLIGNGRLPPHRKVIEKKRLSVEVDFWNRVDKGDPVNCWEWKSTKNNHTGYGVFRRDKVSYAHRFAYKITHDDFDPSLQVLHTCDNPACCNPSHLYQGTPADNMRDRDVRGRTSKKYPDSLIVEIIEKYKSGKYTQKALADEYGTNRTYISRLVTRKVRKHLETQP